MIMTLLLLFALITTELIGAEAYDQCPTNIARNQYLRTHRDRCYQFISTKKKWFDAKYHCEQQGGSLLTIERPDIQEFLERSLTNVTWSRNRVWIGATDDHDEQDWKWVTGQNVSTGYSNWKEGSPSCYLPVYLCREDCACLLPDEGYIWYTTFCSANDFEYEFICQYDMILEATTRTSTFSPTATSTHTTTSSKKKSTQNTTTTTAAKKYIPSFKVVPTTHTYVSRAPDITEAGGVELKTNVIIWSILVCLGILIVVLLAIAAFISCYLRKHTPWHKRNKDIKMRYSKTAVPGDDDHVCSDLLDKDRRCRTVCSTSIQEASSDAESFKTAGSQGSSDSQIGSNQYVTPLHVSATCRSDHMDLDQHLERLAQEIQASSQPTDPAGLNAAAFNIIADTQENKFYS